MDDQWTRFRRVTCSHHYRTDEAMKAISGQIRSIKKFTSEQKGTETNKSQRCSPPVKILRTNRIRERIPNIFTEGEDIPSTQLQFWRVSRGKGQLKRDTGKGYFFGAGRSACSRSPFKRLTVANFRGRHVGPAL